MAPLGILPFIAAAKSTPYEIEQSLRFNQSYLLRTPSSAGNRQTYTFSVWLKRMNTGRDGFFGAWSAVTSRDAFRFDSGTDELRIFLNETTSANIYSNAKYRDYSGWYHVVAAVDTTQATAADRVKVWINGELVSFRSASYPAQNSESYFNNTVKHYIGTTNTQTDQEWQGYLAEFHHVDGTALDHEDFGEYDDNGVWRPKRYTGSYGTNGFYLKFDPSATNGIGHDHSGNGNNFTPTGFTTSGTGTDVMSDTPTTNYATLNPLWARNTYGLSTLSNGNLEFSDAGISTSWGGRGSTFEISSGKWYMEWKCTDSSGQNLVLAVLNTGHYGLQHFMVQNPQNQTGCWGPQENGTLRWIILNGTQTTSGAPYYDTLNGQIVGIAIDADAGTATWYRNGTAITSLTDVDISASSKDAWVVMGITSNGSGTLFVANFGQRAFEQTPPTGYSAWNTANLPAPDIADGSEYFGTALYAGSLATAATVGATQDVTGLNTALTPDMVWIKNRGSGRHVIFDVLRLDADGDNALRVDTTDAEAANVRGGVSSLNAGGFTAIAGSDSSDNTGVTCQTGNNYVAWAWAGGGSGSSNTDGSITSTVSASPTSGFSIGTFTGTGSSGSIGHGLGVAPKFVLIKRTNVSGNSWAVYHDAVGPNKQFLLNSTNAATTTDTNGFPSAPSSTAINVGSGAQMDTNQVGAHVFYAFAEVEGYSKFGSYEGNNSADGPFVALSFAPAFLLVKAADSTGDWQIVDNKRDVDNPTEDVLQPSLSSAEVTATSSAYLHCDLLSNGFKIRGNSSRINVSNTYIYAAFAENPFGGSGVSPATAR